MRLLRSLRRASFRPSSKTSSHSILIMSTAVRITIMADTIEARTPPLETSNRNPAEDLAVYPIRSVKTNFPVKREIKIFSGL